MGLGEGAEAASPWEARWARVCSGASRRRSPLWPRTCVGTQSGGTTGRGLACALGTAGALLGLAPVGGGRRARGCLRGAKSS